MQEILVAKMWEGIFENNIENCTLLVNSATINAISEAFRWKIANGAT